MAEMHFTFYRVIRMCAVQWSRARSDPIRRTYVGRNSTIPRSLSLVAVLSCFLCAGDTLRIREISRPLPLSFPPETETNSSHEVGKRE